MQSNNAPRHPLRHLLILSGAMILAMLALSAACGGDDDSSGNSGSPTETRSSGDHTATPGSTHGGGGTTPTKNATGGDAKASLEALAGEYNDFSGYVKYETTGDFGSSDSSPSSIAIYKDGTNSRVDIADSSGTSSFITTADATYICSEGQCLKYPAGDTSADPTAFFTSFLSADAIQSQIGNLPDNVSVDTSNEDIAGVSANCFSYTGDFDTSEAGDESGKLCFSESGLLLQLDFTSASGSGSFKATDASNSVSDSDFEPPFPVTDLSDILGTPSS